MRPLYPRRPPSSSSSSLFLSLSSFSCSSLSYEVVIVEDSSPDNTYEVALRLQDAFGRDKIKIVHRAGKQGLGTAYIDGLKVASGAFIFIMDADMSHHVRALSVLAASPSDGAATRASAPSSLSRLLSLTPSLLSPPPAPPIRHAARGHPRLYRQAARRRL